MRAEFYIAQVIRWNASLREELRSVLGIGYQTDDPVDLLRDLWDEESLMQYAHRLDCEPDGVFSGLRTRLGQLLGVASPSHLPTLSPSSLRLFFDDAYIRVLASGLKCPSHWPEVVSRLFDVNAMVDLLDRAGVRQPGEEIPIETLFWRLCSSENTGRIARYLGGAVDIWSILSSLILDRASQDLTEYLDCEPEQIFSAALARAADLAGHEEDHEGFEDTTQRFDMLGVARLKQLLRTISETYMREAEEEARKVWRRTTAPQGAKMTLPLLRFHGSRAYREALNLSVPATQTVGTLGFDLEPASQPEYDAQYDLRCRLEGEGENTSVLVEFGRFGSEKWSPLLRLRGSGTERREHVVRHLPKRSQDLLSSGRTLVERILQHPIPAFPSPANRSWALLCKRDDRLVRYFVLSGRLLRDEVNIVGVLGAPSGQATDVSTSVRTAYPTAADLHKRILGDERRRRQG